MHKMLHDKADVQRLYIPKKDGGSDLIEVKKSIQNSNNRGIGLDHYLKHKEGQFRYMNVKDLKPTFQ